MDRPDSLRDTIVACATPPGEGAIAVVRLSGERALPIAARLSGREEPESHRLVRASLRGPAGDALDQGMLVAMRAPRSYTGEDVVELHLHGSRAVVAAVLEACLGEGARLARPGEFTLRAFLNGRMDLAQAEAVADLIHAKGDEQRRAAASQLAGGLSGVVLELCDILEGVLARWRATLDFPDDYEEDAALPEQRQAVRDVDCRIQRLIEGARIDLGQGLKVVLCGAPNSGKSTLLNAWAGRERVLVDAEPGTTRDPVEVELVEGRRLVVCDTAGIRSEATGVEARGIAMSLARIREADVALWLVSPEAPAWPPAELAVSVVGSKADLAEPATKSAIEQEAEQRRLPFVGWVSAKRGEGLSELRRAIGGDRAIAAAEGETVVVRQRHLEALRRCHAALGRLLAEVTTLDVACLELEEGCRALGQILGRDVDAAVLERIFAELCIGK